MLNSENSINTKDLMRGAIKSINYILRNPEILQKPKMVEVSAEIKNYIKEAEIVCGTLSEDIQETYLEDKVSDILSNYVTDGIITKDVLEASFWLAFNIDEIDIHENPKYTYSSLASRKDIIYLTIFKLRYIYIQTIFDLCGLGLTLESYIKYDVDLVGNLIIDRMHPITQQAKDKITLMCSEIESKLIEYMPTKSFAITILPSIMNIIDHYIIDENSWFHIGNNMVENKITHIHHELYDGIHYTYRYMVGDISHVYDPNLGIVTNIRLDRINKINSFI
jgi:hypothetical protein